MASSVPTSIITASLMGCRGIPTAGGGARIAPSPMEVSFVRDASRVSQARRIGTAWLRNACRVHEVRVDSAEVVISELVGNAVVHGTNDAVGLRMRYVHGEIRLEVDDGSPSDMPRPRRAGAEAEQGRGLWLVDALIAELGGSWGFTDDGTVAWCVFPVTRETCPMNGGRAA
ncbi:ATP-binding protein [Streptomyces sp. NPDC012756]|uniref:ATP-binding protein n=1 Tax=Streptomyces sp. NPDC012756 TaxID=3364847 RepID=UPI0036A0A103